MSRGKKEIKSYEKGIRIDDNEYIEKDSKQYSNCMKDDVFCKLQEEIDSLVEQREELRGDLTSMDNQMLGLKNEVMLVDKSTKGLTLPA